MVKNWNPIEYYNTTTSTWTAFTRETNESYNLENTTEELDGDEQFTFKLRNNPANRELVCGAISPSIRLKYDNSLILDGILGTPELTAKTITCVVYNDEYEQLKKREFNGSYSNPSASTLLNAIATAAGLTVGTCPSTTITGAITFLSSTCFNAMRFVAFILGKHYWSNNGTINIGIRGNTALALQINEGEGAALTDKSGNENHLTIDGATWNDKELNYDGTNDSAYITHNSSLEFSTSDLTISLTFKIDASCPDSSLIIGKGTGNGRFLAIFYNNTVRINSYFGAGKDYWLTGTTNVNDGQEHMLVIVFNRDGTQKLYIDNNLQDSIDISSAVSDAWDSSSNLIVGGQWTNWFKGIIKKVLIYKRAFNTDECTYLHINKIKDASPRVIEHMKKYTKVKAVGQDSDGNFISATAGTGDDVYIHKVTRVTDADMLTLIAEKKLAELNTVDGKITLQLYPLYCAKYQIGDVLPCYCEKLALSGMYVISKLEKDIGIIEAEVGRREMTQDEKLAELSQYEGLGIVQELTLSASDSVRWNNSEEKYAQSLSWVKLKEIKVTVPATGSYRVKYDSASGGSAWYFYEYGTAFEIRKNGVFIGGSHYQANADWDTVSQDFSGGLAEGDLIQLYGISDELEGDPPELLPGTYAIVRNFRICYDPGYDLGFVNQDP